MKKKKKKPLEILGSLRVVKHPRFPEPITVIERKIPKRRKFPRQEKGEKQEKGKKNDSNDEDQGLI